MSELYDAISLESFSVQDSSIQALNDIKENIEENKMNYPLRCPECWRIARIVTDLYKNKYCSICDLNHKNEVNLFELFIENANKDIKNLLCQNCKKKEEDISKMFYCLECTFFFCSDCKNLHKEEKNHSKFMDLFKFDNYCEKHDEPFQYFDNNQKKNICQKCYDEEIKSNLDNKKYIIEASKFNDYQKSINDNYIKAKENLKMWKNTMTLINNWLENINNKFNNFTNSIYNYILLQLKTISLLKDETNYEKYKNNFNIYYSYDAINNEEVDKYISVLNKKLNKDYKENDNIYNMSKILFDVLDDFDKKDLNIESKEKISIELKKNNSPIENLLSEDKKIDIDGYKIENMEEKNYKLNSKVKCLIPFDSNNYFIIGYDTGEIELCKENIIDEEEKVFNLDKKLKIKEFNNEIDNLCEIDSDKIVASDIQNNIKIIQFLDNLKNYSVIQNLELLEDSNKLHTIAHLPIFSYYRNRHYFCFGDDNNIIIYKSNKMPKDLKPPGLYYHKEIQEFSIVQPSNYFGEQNNDSISFNMEKEIKLKTPVHCILEINEKLMVATCPKENSLKIYNCQIGFKEILVLPNIYPSEGKYTLSLDKNKERLIVACEGGFGLININNYKKVKKFHLNQKIACLCYYYKFNDLCTCISIKGENTFIKQYKIPQDLKNVSKFSEKKINSEQGINNLINIKDRIYYLDNSNFIHFYQKV